MALGSDGKLYILAFDHRGSFTKKWFGIEGAPDKEQTATITDGKRVIYEGFELAIGGGLDASTAGGLIDEQFGGDVPGQVKRHGAVLAMPVEKSGMNEFDFEYGEQFGEKILEQEPDFSKVLVRFNPEGDPELNARQTERLKQLSDWLKANDRKFLYELLVPAEPHQLESVGGDTDRYDAELRPELMRQVIELQQNAGIEADIWKIEGVDTREDCEMLAAQTRTGGRDHVTCVLLGRGASDEKVDHWLKQAAPVDGFVGFAIGRSIWGDALAGFLGGSLDRATAAKQIGDNYSRFISVYEGAE